MSDVQFIKNLGYTLDGTPIKKVCVACGSLYQIKKTQPTQQSCSRVCANKAKILSSDYRKKRSDIAKRRVGVLNPNFKGGGKTFKCTHCGVDFQVPHHALRRGKSSGKFCSKSCTYQYRVIVSMSQKQVVLTKNIRKKLLNFLFRRNLNLPDIYISYIGCYLSEFRGHIESKFKKGMGWDNKDLWHIDHENPVSLFRYETTEDEDFKKCWHYTNLRPLWAEENMRKTISDRKLSREKYETSDTWYTAKQK
jgi:hypothetical protein